MFTPENVRAENSASGIIGAVPRLSSNTNATSNKVPAVSETTTIASLHPRSGAAISP
jgi:hypothetical protein